jgi:hypothetical protein
VSRPDHSAIPGRAAAFLRRCGIGNPLTTIVVTIVVLSGFGAPFLLAAPAGASGDTLYVSSSGTDSGDCTSLAGACATITYALTQANSGDTIEVSGTIDDNPTVNIAVTITQMPGGSPAVINGGSNGSVFVIANKQGIEVTLDGLVVQNGASSDGGGIAIDGNPTLTVTDSVISGNTASGGGQGGGIYNNGNSTLNVVDSTVSGNTDSSGGQGGGIYNDGTLTVTNATVSANTAEGGGQGAGVYSDGTATVTDSTVSGNTAPGGGQGAGIYNSGTATVTDSTIADNVLPGPSAGEGAGIYNSGAATIADSTMSGNAAPDGGQGGGVYSGPGQVLQLLQASALSSGIRINQQQCLNNCNQQAQSAVLAGDILATPGGAPAGGECAGGGFTDAGYNVDDDGTCGLSDPSVSDSATIDNFLGSLAGNGGPTDTIALLPGSPVAPDPAQAVIPASFTAAGLTASSCSQFDQRGIGRGTPCDMGAYALTTPTITSADTTTFTLGNAGTFQIVANSSSPTTFSETGTLPSGVSLTPAGLLSGIPGPGTGGSYPITVTASDGPLTNTTQAFSLIVEGPPVITSSDHATFTLGEPGAFLVTSAGDPTPALSEIGVLPAGVTFSDNNDGTATLAGTPEPGTDGVYSIATIAINGTNPPAIATLTLTVVQEPSVTTAEQAGFTLGQPGSFTVTTTGYPAAALQMNGALPDGLIFTDNGDGTATISGTPRHLTGSPVALSVQATNAAGSVTSPLAVTVSSGKAWLAGSDGAVYPVGTATSFGSMQAYKLNKPVVGMAAAPDGGGYWLVASDGGVFNFGDAGFYGSTGGIHLNKPIVGIATTPDGGGYWLVASDGGVFNYGDAGFYGSRGGQPLNAPIVGIAATPDGGGYWLVASDGGIFNYGDAGFYGSTGGVHLNKPIVGIAGTPDGGGYWLVASDGGVFNYGDAAFFGSVPAGGSGSLTAPVVGITSSADGRGYSLATSIEDVIPFGDGVAGVGNGVQAPIVGISSP